MGIYSDQRYEPFWTWTDDNLEVEELDTKLKNILTYNGYAKFSTLKSLDEFPFNECKEGVRSPEYLHLAEQYVQQGEKLEDFFGFYHMNPQNFVFNSGDKKDIERLMDLIKNTSGRQYKRSREGIANVQNDEDPAANREHIRRTLNNHRNYKADIKHLITNNIEVEIMGARKARVSCPVVGCSAKLTVYKRFQTKSWCWSIDYFTSHFKTHSVTHQVAQRVADGEE